MEELDVTRAGRHQATAYLEGTPLDLMEQEFAPQTVDDAYEVQRSYIEHLTASRGSLGGFKIAYTSAVMRESRGVSEPCTGRIFNAEIANSPATLSAADYASLAIECEVGVRLASHVTPEGAPYTRGSIAPHVASLVTAFEVVDQRPSGARQGADPAISGIVGNISCAGAVVGPEVSDWQSIDLAASRGTMSINGEQVGEGLGSDVMGHPLEALVWLANNLAVRGESMPAGALVITGSIIPPTPLKAGDVATISIEGLGAAQITVT